MDKQDIHILRLMGEIEENGGSSQRELARRLNLSLGLINTFLKRLVRKGYFKVKTMPGNRVKYFLTPEGVARKTRLTVEYLRYSARFYRDIKKVLMDKFRELEEAKVGSLIFFGVGEVAEIAYLYLQLTAIRLIGVVDDNMDPGNFFDFKIEGLDRLDTPDWDAILLTRLNHTEADMIRLTERGVDRARIVTL